MPSSGKVMQVQGMGVKKNLCCRRYFFVSARNATHRRLYSAARVFNSDFISSSSSSDAFLSAVASWQQRQHWQQCVSDATRAASRCLFTPV